MYDRVIYPSPEFEQLGNDEGNRVIDLVEGRFSWARDHPSQIHITEEEPQVFREIKDDHIDRGASNRLFGFDHVKRIETVHVEAEREAYFISPAAEKALSVDVPEVPENRSVPNVLRGCCRWTVAGLTE